MIKELDHQAKAKATPRKLIYVGFEKEAPDRSKSLENRSQAKKRSRRKKSKLRERRSEHQKTSTDSEYDEDSEDTCEDLNSPYKRPKPTSFTPRITRFKYHRRTKLLRNIRVYEGNKDPEDHLSIFSVAAEQEEWPMPIWCKMFRQTLGGAARNWFDDLDPESVDSFKELS
nr:reverse transcriptase domain-containing protein [Tanacetum cinerariifolium]